jgi:putative addiction module killer protein
MEIRKTSVFDEWLKNLRDSNARTRILTRIKRLAEGNPGDCGPIGEGLSEMRVFCGPGYRVYFKDAGVEIVILLCGGDKSTQQKDIETAKNTGKGVLK